MAIASGVVDRNPGMCIVEILLIGKHRLGGVVKVRVGVPGEPKWEKARDDQHRRNTSSWTLINVVFYEEVADWKKQLLTNIENAVPGSEGGV